MILILFALFSGSCSLLQEVPTLVPEIKLNQGPDESQITPDGREMDESPRPSSRVSIPPTWTPPVSSSIEQTDGPFKTPNAPVADGQQTYIVQSGDTLGEIATRFNVTIDAIAQANGITDLDHIEEGQVLVIPDNQ